MRITSAHFGSDTTESYWGQTYHHGNLFVVVELRAQEEFLNKDDKEALTVDVKHQILRRSIKVLTPDSIDTLAKLLEAVNTISSGFEDTREFSLIVGKVINNIFYTVIHGDGKIFLLRDGLLAVIREGQGSSSGILKKGDGILLLSPSLSAALNDSQIKGVLSQSVQDTADTLVVLIHNHEDIYGCGMYSIVNEIMDKKHGQVNRGSFNVKVEAGVVETQKLNSVTKGQRLKKIISTRLQSIRSIISKTRIIFIQRFRTRSSRMWGSMLFVLILLFLASVSFGIVKKREGERIRILKAVKDSTIHEIDEAEALIGINDTRARELLVSARRRLSPIVQSFPKRSLEYEEVQQYLQRINSLETEATRIFRLTDVSVFYDLDLVKSKGEGSDMSLYRDTIFVLDTKNQAVYSITSKKQATIVAGGESIHSARFVAAYGERLYIVKAKEIVIFGSNGKVVKTKSLDDISSISDAESFGGNVYLIDEAGNAIWKYPSTNEGLGGHILWLPDDESHSFSSKSSMAIDGAIWTISRGVIGEFVQGKPDVSFKLSGLNTPFSIDSSLYTDDRSEALYVLDRGNKRVVVLSKEGIYKEQYVWDGIKDVSNIAVLEKDGIILLLSGRTIYSIKIHQ